MNNWIFNQPSFLPPPPPLIWHRPCNCRSDRLWRVASPARPHQPYRYHSLIRHQSCQSCIFERSLQIVETRDAIAFLRMLLLLFMLLPLLPLPPCPCCCPCCWCCLPYLRCCSSPFCCCPRFCCCRPFCYCCCCCRRRLIINTSCIAGRFSSAGSWQRVRDATPLLIFSNFYLLLGLSWCRICSLSHS